MIIQIIYYNIFSSLSTTDNYNDNMCVTYSTTDSYENAMRKLTLHDYSNSLLQHIATYIQKINNQDSLY